jgi:hypothetical protein
VAERRSQPSTAQRALDTVYLRFMPSVLRGKGEGCGGMRGRERDEREGEG